MIAAMANGHPVPTQHDVTAPNIPKMKDIMAILLFFSFIIDSPFDNKNN